MDQHLQIRQRLADKNIGVAPLMLVQVEDQAAGCEDPVERVRDKLLELPGVTSDLIAVHTSGEPDADFHMLAYDHAKQILIFKVAVATGFDAPGAWTLVSVRRTAARRSACRSSDGSCGCIRSCGPAMVPTICSTGYVFLTDPDMQAGLSAAVDELKAVRQSLTVLSDQLDVVTYGAGGLPALVGEAHRLSAYAPPPPQNAEERQARLALLIDEGVLGRDDMAGLDPATIARAIVTGETVGAASRTPLFGHLPEQNAPAAPPKPGKLTAYHLRTGLGVPKALWQDFPLTHQALNDPVFIADVADAFCNRSQLLGELHRTQRGASASLRDLFLDGEQREVSLSLRVSNARVADKAQQAFQLNDSIDPRLLKRALIAALRTRAEKEGYPSPSVGEETRAVAPHVPPLVVRTALVPRRRELPCGNVVRAVFGREQHGGRPADDLLGRPAEDRLGSRGPVAHHAIRVGDQDRMILDAFQDAAVAFLGLAQRAVRRAQPVITPCWSRASWSRAPASPLSRTSSVTSSTRWMMKATSPRSSSTASSPGSTSAPRSGRPRREPRSAARP